jgi:predicted AAA+ superfamily ATPase
MDDFQKYNANMDTDTIRRVFDYALHNVCGQTKASSAVDGISAYIFDECISILRRAGLVYPVKASPCDTIPLGTAEKNTNKKLLVFDTGVYLTMCGLNVGELLSADIFDEMNKGAVVEMQTGLELIKYNSWYSEANLYYWYRSGANAEVDYCIVKENLVVPIEVKASGKGSMQSMKSFLESHAQSPYGIRVSLENFGSYDKIRVYPVYAVHRLIKDKI